MIEIALGTVQFGLDYGVTNSDGRVTTPEVRDILDLAASSGINWLDTAAAYGDAETLLGGLAETTPFRICTKIGAAGGGSIPELSDEAARSAERLGRTALDILLLHRADMLQNGAEAFRDWAQAERESGRIHAFGVSLYSPDEIELALRAGVDWVQVPISILAQEWLEGGIDRLREVGVRIQVRSLLAQGLVAADPEKLPAPLASTQGPLRRLRAAAAEVEMEPLDLAFSFAATLPVDMLVLGVQSASQLARCLRALRSGVTMDWTRFAGDQRALDPRAWPPGMRIS